MRNFRHYHAPYEFTDSSRLAMQVYTILNILIGIMLLRYVTVLDRHTA